MAYGNRGYGYRHSYKRNIGRERAREHIREAERLSLELGGSDADVKEYFFSLSPERLNSLFQEYGREFGAKAQAYAERTFSKWKSGKVHMSGLVASRLFSLLPPRMPVAEKYKLTENLWNHVGPKSHKVIVVGSDAETEDVVLRIEAHIEDVIDEYKIPSSLEARFNWLSAGDVHMKQDLLQHIREDEGDFTHRLQQTFMVGKHQLDLFLDKAASGVRLEEPSNYDMQRFGRGSSQRSLAWLWVALLAGFVLFFLLY